jgi:sugar/nucleoside kinase (ribokinase family)
LVPAGQHLNSKVHDVIGLSNLCVDIVIPVQELPPVDPAARQGLLQQLTAAPPDEQHWELGGNCNFMIAAARMGMRVGSIGHVGDDVYGRYMDRVLQVSKLSSNTGTAHCRTGWQRRCNS